MSLIIGKTYTVNTDNIVCYKICYPTATKITLDIFLPDNESINVISYNCVGYEWEDICDWDRYKEDSEYMEWCDSKRNVIETFRSRAFEEISDIKTYIDDMVIKGEPVHLEQAQELLIEKLDPFYNEAKEKYEKLKEERRKYRR